MRSITPVVAIVVLLLMTVAAASMAFLVISPHQGFQSGSRIESVGSGIVYFRNTGNTDLSNFQVFINGALVDSDCSPDPLLPGKIAACLLSDLSYTEGIDENVELKIVTDNSESTARVSTSLLILPVGYHFDVGESFQAVALILNSTEDGSGYAGYIDFLDWNTTESFRIRQHNDAGTQKLVTSFNDSTTLTDLLTLTEGGIFSILSSSGKSLNLYHDDTDGVIEVSSGSLNIRDSVFYVSDLAEINSAISSIGSGGGTIIIESGNIPVTSTININGGGSYRIIGQGADTVLQLSNGNSVFSITSAQECSIENLKIDVQSETSTTAAILINEASDNTVLVKDVIIDGTGNGEDCYAFDIRSDNNIISSCELSELRLGFDVYGNYNKIQNCFVHDLDSPDGGTGSAGTGMIVVNVTGSDNEISNCLFDTITSGSGGADVSGTGGSGASTKIFYVTGSNNKIIKNSVHSITAGNGGNGVVGGSGGDIRVIDAEATGSFNVFSENRMDSVTVGDGGDGSAGNGGNAGTPRAVHTDGPHSLISHNQISNIFGGTGGTGTGGTGGTGDGYFIIIAKGSESIINANIIKTVVAGNGGDGGSDGDDGGNGAWGSAITVDGSGNCVVSNNYISDVTGGSGGNAGGPTSNGGNGAWGSAMWIRDDYSTVSGNIIKSIRGGDGGSGGATSGTGGDAGGADGIFLVGDYSTVSGNDISLISSSSAGTGSVAGSDMSSNGINVGTTYAAISGNNINNFLANNGAYIAGIYIPSGGDQANCNGNMIYNITNTGSGTGYGIYIVSGANEVTIYGNTALGCDTNLSDSGTNTFGDSTTNNVS